MNGRQTWLRLETILDRLLEMIAEGKAMINLDLGQWKVLSYTSHDLNRALYAFNTLVDAIRSRMPFQTQNAEHLLIDLVTSGNPGRLHPNSFVHRFLTQCSRLTFIYITPGLSFARYQPFVPALGQVGSNEIYLVLLSSTHVAHQETGLGKRGEETRLSTFTRDFDRILSYPAGLYLTECNDTIYPFEDGNQ
ncbi:hypothetical protein PtrSN002B_011644 [Pyrenophora tritici-repentis]|uniref:Uncharacterized protein n=1 Tax=Pyrenophora tritici-repentis TaxID=45151 RepID=A0A2W1E5R4_9PLEO|nr:hypothetical protein PtrV1_03427 [Pyrenophora tritici-repentis]KAF7442222.1 hypothetical protein A1F99_130910 [Pyrenophora tritici-repentis]KAF7579414.1 hypothetical protein PtrM4_036540 [Pyrenophora tritici-repentis]KAI0570331.1 hypothetical protein Alg130_11270 [Pyrenophora tritici-repentis]KAI0580378.1 hypothetical protein Alg215_05231 [Pyrenophora tritici-repentis]